MSFWLIYTHVRLELNTNPPPPPDNFGVITIHLLSIISYFSTVAVRFFPPICVPPILKIYLLLNDAHAKLAL